MVTVEQVMSRLSQLGYPVTEAERPVVEFEYNLILDYVVNYCNMFDRSEIPTILDKRIIDRICSEYLFKQQKAGLLPNFNYDAFVKTIKERSQINFSGTINENDKILTLSTCEDVAGTTRLVIHAKLIKLEQR